MCPNAPEYNFILPVSPLCQSLNCQQCKCQYPNVPVLRLGISTRPPTSVPVASFCSVQLLVSSFNNVSSCPCLPSAVCPAARVFTQQCVQLFMSFFSSAANCLCLQRAVCHAARGFIYQCGHATIGPNSSASPVFVGRFVRHRCVELPVSQSVTVSSWACLDLPVCSSQTCANANFQLQVMSESTDVPNYCACLHLLMSS